MGLASQRHLGYAPAQIRVTANYAATATDEFINVGTAGITVTLPLANTRNGTPLRVKDVSGQAGTNPDHHCPDAPVTIDDLANLQICRALVLIPANDGTTTGGACSKC